jgi:hypothetical protein
MLLRASLGSRALVIGERAIDGGQIGCRVFFSHGLFEHRIRGKVAHAVGRVRLRAMAVFLDPACASPDAGTNGVRPFLLVFPSPPPAAGTPRAAFVAHDVGDKRQGIQNNLDAARSATWTGRHKVNSTRGWKLAGVHTEKRLGAAVKANTKPFVYPDVQRARVA